MRKEGRCESSHGQDTVEGGEWELRYCCFNGSDSPRFPRGNRGVRVPEAGVKIWRRRSGDGCGGEDEAESEDYEGIGYSAEEGGDKEEDERNYGPDSIVPDWKCPSKGFDQR